MDRRVKKIIADISAVALLSSYICVPLSNSGVSLDISGLFEKDKVSAESTENYTYQGFTYTVNNDKITITKFDDSISEVTIPDSIDKKPVVCIDEEAFSECKLTSVIFPESVEEIKINAFKDCADLKLVTFNEGLKTIGYHAFYGTALTEVTIPASLTKSSSPFEKCTDLTSVKFAKQCTRITEALFSGCSKLTEINIPDSIEIINDNAFSECTGLTSVIIPATVTEVGINAFMNCLNLKKVTLNEGLKSLGYHAFYGTAVSEITVPASLETTNTPFEKCSNLTSVKFSENCSRITDAMFSHCDKITQIKIPDSITAINDNAFANCTGLTSVTIPSTTKQIGINAFRDCTNLKEIILNEGIEEIGYHAFYGTAISEITVPASLTKTSALFGETNQLTSVKFAENCERITYGLLSGCSKLTQINIPASIQTIEDGAFEGCTGLTSVTIPGTVKKIKTNAFKDCINIKEIILNEGIEEIGYHAFSGTAIQEISIPVTLTSSSAPFAECESLIKVNFADNTTLIPESLLKGCKKITSIDIPQTVKEIGTTAFEDCSALEKITLNDGLEKIGYHAFSGTAIQEISIPATLTGSSAPFAGCEGLIKVNFADNTTLIPESLLKGCKKITSIDIPQTVKEIGMTAFEDCSALEKITLNDGLEKIGYHAFSGTVIQEINIPATLISSSTPFAGCEALTKVNFADDITTIPESLLKGCKKMTSVEVPQTVSEIGSAAFEDCSSLEKVTLNEGLKQIGYHAFSGTPIKEISIPLTLTDASAPFAGCDSITKINFPDSITSVPESLFKGCTAIKEIIIPQTITEIETGAFEGCSALEKVTLNEGLQIIGYHAFSGTAIKEITIPSTVKDLNSPPFAGCKSLTYAVFPDEMEKVPDNIFKDCQSLCSARLSKSITDIGDGSFDRCTSLKTIYSPLKKISFRASSFSDCISLRDPRFSVIDYDNSELFANADSCTVNGTINCTLRYKINDIFEDKPDSYSVVIDVPEGMTVLPDSIVCGDDKCTVTGTDPFTISLSKPEADVKFTARVQEYGDFRITGSVKFRSNFETWKQTVGTLDISAPDITINAADTINSFTADVSGIAVKDKDVSIYADDKLVATVKSNTKTGKYQSSIKLPEKKSGESYSLYATCGEDTSGKISVLYTEEKPVIESAKLKYNKGTYVTDDITDVFTQGESPAFYFNPAYPLVFEINASHTDKIDKMFVSSTKGTQMKYMEAKWNEKTQTWIASGYFDPDNTRYVPGALNISIVEKKENKYDRNSETQNPQKLKNVSENIKNNSSVKITKKTDRAVASDIKISDGKKSNDVSLVSENTDSTYINGNQVKASEIAKDPAKYGYVKSNVKSGADGKTYTYYVCTPDSRDIVSQITNTMGQTYHAIDNMCTGVSILEMAEGDKSDTFDAKIFNSFVTSVSKTVLSDYIGDYTFGGAFSIAGDTSDFMSRLSGTDSEELQCAAIVLYGLQAFNTFGTETVLTLCGCPPIVSSVISGFISVGLGYFGDYLDECINENKQFSLNGFIVFLIDPSGYIYEAVESNRVSDAITTLYYLDPKTQKAVKWDAENYSQTNPLNTDEQGTYAWDVPEGKWQVRCEKEGYESAESQWLDVPPAQTEVNLSLISYQAPEISRIDAYQDFVSVKFSKYMDISTVSVNSLLLNGDDKKILCTVTPQIYSEGDNFTDTFIIKPQSGTLEKYKILKAECTDVCHSYSGTAAKAQSIECTLNTDIFDLSAGNSVTVLTSGTDSELIFTAKPAELAAGKKLIISDKSGIIKYQDDVIFDKSGVAKVKVSAEEAGTAKISVNAENSDKKCESEIIVVNSSVKSSSQTQNNNNYLNGDVDNSGVVNAVDIVMLKKYLLLAASDKEVPNGDVNGSGTVDAMDLIALIKIFLE